VVALGTLWPLVLNVVVEVEVEVGPSIAAGEFHNQAPISSRFIEGSLDYLRSSSVLLLAFVTKMGS
jgi:hypothetical protein